MAALPGTADGIRELGEGFADALYHLLGDWMRGTELVHPGVRIDVQTGGSSRGIADARAGVADLGMISRVLREEEQDLQAFAVARDGVCLIVHADNPVDRLGREIIAFRFQANIGLRFGTFQRRAHRIEIVFTHEQHRQVP